MEQSVALINSNSDIIDYINELYHSKGFEKMCETIQQKGFEITKFKNTDRLIIRIKYTEPCRVWKPKWTRQCRGVTLLLLNDNFVCLKYQLQRGAEILTGLHLKKGIEETESLNLKELEILDDIQQDTVKKILNKEPLDGFLSFKVDGSLLGVSVYSGKYKQIVEDIIKSSNDEFALLVLEISKQKNLPFIPVFGTQGTFFMNEDIHDYMITSIISSLNDINIYEEALTYSPLEVFKKHSNKFFDRLIKFYALFTKKYDTSDVMTLSFEAFCKNRASAWVKQNGRVHTELTISYKSSNIKFLGVSYGDMKINYLPHFAISDMINDSGFEEPLYWFINSPEKIEEMMIDLSDLIKNKDTEKYFEKHKPSNKYPLKELIVDYEGFVFYRFVNGEYDYSKIKTEEYYRCHKLKPENVPYLIDLKDASDIFPTVRNVINFFVNCDDLLIEASRLILEELKNNSNLIDNLPEKAKKSYSKQNEITRYKMLINVSEMYNQMSYDVFKQIFKDLDKSLAATDDIFSVLRALIMKIEPWKEDYQDKIKLMIKSKDKLICSLYDILSKS